jgi:hypothetical protein
MWKAEMGCSEVAIRYFSSVPSKTFLVNFFLVNVWNKYLIKLFVKVIQLGCLGHNIFVHEEGRLDGCVTSLCKEVETVLDEGEIQSHAMVGEKVSSVTDDLDSTVLIVAIYSVENVVMREDVCPCCRGLAIRGPTL